MAKKRQADAVDGGDNASKNSKKNNKKRKVTPDKKGDSADGDSGDQIKDADGIFKVGARIFAKYAGDGTYRLCEVIHVQKLETPKPGGNTVKYYVHYVEFNRRMDTWIEQNDAHEEHPDGSYKKSDIVEFVEEDYGDSNGMDEASIREHEEITKIKNVNRIELGRNVISTWYFSPIPREFIPDGSVDLLYVSEFTLDFYRTSAELARHYKRVKVWHPPGDEIYRDEKNRVAMFEVDGAKSKVYSQNLCYLAKMFLDHKTLHYDVDPFLFYILCEFDEKGYHIVGYFSKEKYSEQGNNLACILTLPPYQRKGYGRFLMSFSYELSKKEGKVGSPEKPLSDLGQIGYRSYWSRAILEVLAKLKGESVSIMELTRVTSIKTEDVVLALKFLGLIKYVHGRHVLCVDEKLMQEKMKQFESKGPKVDPEKLHWAPLKVDVKRDKWSIKAKRKADPNAAAVFD
mmetsp:Transcript_14290/g.25602  ORF Transcript_14290/g.25602 Transcript_14290/m.25602 type:complete len:457 (-) Transcript_14290:123-1493(-)